ncbi:MAG: hypothetical protein CL674_00495 [Bdellovibrionaceae bacterium]|nr:hypothetical protein [Pseudobdellovibrionaceae bacterium]
MFWPLSSEFILPYLKDKKPEDLSLFVSQIKQQQFKKDERLATLVLVDLLLVQTIVLLFPRLCYGFQYLGPALARR